MEDDGTRLTLRPLGLTAPEQALPGARRLAGGWLCFDRCEAVLRTVAGGEVARRILPLADLDAWAGGLPDPLQRSYRLWLERLTAERRPVAGLALDRPRLMGIVNVTPDSFSDGGCHADADRAVAHGIGLAAAGADIVDVGAESTRPGAAAVPAEDQIARAVPVIAQLAERGICVSVDTRNAEVMAAALAAGARLVNDVSGLRHDRRALAVVGDAMARDPGVAVVVMHMRGEPATMNQTPTYDDPALDVFDELAERLQWCEEGGLDRARILVDPGIGFAKRMEHGAAVARSLSLLHGLGCGLLAGFSRKGLVRGWADSTAPRDRLPGSLAAAIVAFEQGVQILRVHDVRETAQARDVWEALRMR
ncbi:dihydropteroate synthase [Azospirillum endophyticum]